MSTYYPAPRRHASLVPSSPAHQPPNHRRFSIDQTSNLPAYIFPSPSSAPPSPSPSLSHSSLLSEQSDASFSLVSLSEIGSPESSPLLPPVEHGPVRPTPRQPLDSLESPLNAWTDVQGSICKPKIPSFSASILSDQVVLDIATESPPNGEAILVSTSSVNSERVKAILRHPLDRITTRLPLDLDDQEQLLPSAQRLPSFLEKPPPLLSLFSSLLGVDELTLGHLTRSASSASIFFPTEEGFDATCLNESEVHPSAHGVEKLYLATAPEKGYMSIHQGILLLDDTPTSEFCLRPIPSIWFVVTELVSNGRRLLRCFLNSLTTPSPAQ